MGGRRLDRGQSFGTSFPNRTTSQKARGSHATHSLRPPCGRRADGRADIDFGHPGPRPNQKDPDSGRAGLRRILSDFKTDFEVQEDQPRDLEQTRGFSCGRLKGSANGFLQLKQVLHKATGERVQAVKLSTNQSSTSSIIQLGSSPTGTGVEFDWDRSQPACLVGMAINASDTLGVAIGGLKAGDKVEVLRATGICTFDKDTGHPLLASLIGLLGEGTQDAIDAFVGTEFDNVIKSATTDLQTRPKGRAKGQCSAIPTESCRDRTAMGSTREAWS